MHGLIACPANRLNLSLSGKGTPHDPPRTDCRAEGEGVMGWRDLLEAAAEEVDFGTMEYDGPAQLLLAMPAPDRIALARELLAGTGKVITDREPTK